jgi:hypothetical protein
MSNKKEYKVFSVAKMSKGKGKGKERVTPLQARLWLRGG